MSTSRALGWLGSLREELGFALIALALGLFRLGDKGLWVDEAVSLRFALQAPETWLHDHNMALFYTLLSGVVRVLGDGEGALRALSVACFAASVPLFFAFLRAAADLRTARIGCALFVANAYLVHFAQEARGYMLAVSLVIAASLALLRLVERPSTARALGYAVLIGLALYAHAFALWVLFAHALAVIGSFARERRLWPSLGLAFAGALACAAPLLLAALRAGSTQISWLKQPSLESCWELFSWLAGDSWLAVAYVALWLSFLVACAQELAGTSKPLSFAQILVALWFLVPLVGTLAFSRWVTPIVHPKYLLVALPGLIAAVAVSIASLRSVSARRALLTALLALSGHDLWSYYARYEKEQWRELVAWLGQQVQPGDALVLDLSAPEPFDYYVLRTPAPRRLPRPLIPDRAWSVLWSEIREYDAREQAARLARANRIWLIRNRSQDDALRAQVARTRRSVWRRELTPADGDARSLFASSNGRIIFVERFEHPPDSLPR